MVLPSASRGGNIIWQRLRRPIAFVLVVLVMMQLVAVHDGSSLVLMKDATKFTGTAPPIVPLRKSCVWDETLEDCYNLLSEHIFGDTLPQHNFTPALQPRWISKWYFLGDSTLFRLLEVWKKNQEEYPFTTVKREPPARPAHLKLSQYYGLPQDMSLYVPPNATAYEGPTGRQPFRMDCTNCKNTWFRIQTEQGGLTVDFEWLGVEFSKDVTFPTPFSRTSQETAAYHIAQQQSKWRDPQAAIMTEKKDTFSRVKIDNTLQPIQGRGRTACVASVGLHDMKFVNMTTQEYVERVHDYQGLLERACGKVADPTLPPPLLIWLGMSAVMGKPTSPQRNDKIVAWNQAVANSLKKGWIYLDVYPKSKMTKHDDNVHLDRDLYYKPLSNVFWGLAKGKDWRTVVGGDG